MHGRPTLIVGARAHAWATCPDTAFTAAPPAPSSHQHLQHRVHGAVHMDELLRPCIHATVHAAASFVHHASSPRCRARQWRAGASEATSLFRVFLHGRASTRRGCSVVGAATTATAAGAGAPPLPARTCTHVVQLEACARRVVQNRVHAVCTPRVRDARCSLCRAGCLWGSNCTIYAASRRRAGAATTAAVVCSARA